MSTVEVIFLTSSVLTFATGLLILSINRWRTINQAYAIVATLTAIWLFAIFRALANGHQGDDTTVIFWIRLATACSVFLPWSFALNKAAITKSYSLLQSIKGTIIWLIFGVLLTVLVFSRWYIPEDSTTLVNKRGFGYILYLICMAGLCMTVIYDALRSLPKCSGIRLLELKFFVLNICLSTLAVLALSTASRLFDITVLRHIAPFVIIISYGLTIWAICSHRIFDSRQVFATFCRHASSLGVLTSSITIGHHFLSDVLPDQFSLILSSGIGGILTSIWDSKVCIWLNLSLNHQLAKPRAQIVEMAREVADSGKLLLCFEDFLQDYCQCERVSIHTLESLKPATVLFEPTNYSAAFPLLRENGYITPETLARRAPNPGNQSSQNLLTANNLAAIIAVPRGSDSPSCVVAFGPKVSLRPFTHPDIQVLIELVTLMDNILTHSRVAAHAARIEKMESAAMMSRGLAHDLNNLTTPVSTFLLHMENRVTAGSLEAEVLADAQHSVKVMQDYIRESLFFARRLVPDFKRISSSEIIASVVKLTQSRAESHQVSLQVAAMQEVSFMADDALLQRLLQNLIFNGIDATPAGGNVTLSMAVVDKERICFTVLDQGQGISPTIMDRLFEPYFTTKDTGHAIRGLGLGLAISQKISDLHSGEIKVTNLAAGGAAFSFTLPLDRVLSPATRPRHERFEAAERRIPSFTSRVLPS